MAKYSAYFRFISDPSDDITDSLLLHADFPLHGAFRELCKAIQAQDGSTPPPPKRLRGSSPLVLVAFDEIHYLVGGGTQWSRFAELRRAIRGLRNDRFFALLLSTSGAAFTITPTPTRDVSARMVHSGNVMLPFCELGFDHLANALDFSKTVLLSRVTSLNHLVSYGRPL